MGFIHRRRIGIDALPPGARDAVALAHRERNGFECIEVGEQRVDLERAHQPARDALVRRQRRDVLRAEHDRAGVGPQHAGHQVDERRLAGAVRADQRVASALRQLERNVLRDDERSEALVEPARGQRRVHDLPREARHEPASILSPPRIPFGRNITTAISSMPIQKYQNCGVVPEN